MIALAAPCAVLAAYVALGWFTGWPCWWWRALGVRVFDGALGEWAWHVTPRAWGVEPSGMHAVGLGGSRFSPHQKLASTSRDDGSRERIPRCAKAAASRP